MGIASMVTCWVKRQNPYLCARSCPAMGEPHEVNGNIYPRYMIILSLLRQNSAYMLQTHLEIGVFVYVLQLFLICQKTFFYPA